MRLGAMPCIFKHVGTAAVPWQPLQQVLLLLYCLGALPFTGRAVAELKAALQRRSCCVPHLQTQPCKSKAPNQQ